jgi:hypothetical protein
MFARSKRTFFRLIVIGLLAWAWGCYHASAGGGGRDTDTGTSTDSDSDTDADTDSDTDTDSDSDGDTDTALCGGYPEEVYIVPSPPAGLDPTVAALCDSGTPTAVSNTAALVALGTTSWDMIDVDGQIAVAADLVGRVIGLPTIEITSAIPVDLLAAIVSEVAPSGDGFSFHVEFPSSAWFATGDTELVVRVTFEVACSDASGDTQQVEATTYLHLCDSADYPIWVASGGECTVCSEICEKIACPLPASRERGPAALSGSPQAEIVPVAIYGRSVALCVEHRGTEGPLSYAWRVSGGRVSGDDTAGIIWEVPSEPGPHLVQVAVKDSTSATVATLRWRHRA